MADAAELFEAIAHPVRIKILKILEKEPCSFASLKRQLGLASSGNLDFHLKKLGELVTVREDGLYALTQAGKEALPSIDRVETWTEMERHRTRMFTKMPKEAISLGMLEICTTISILLFFLTLVQLPPSRGSLWGFLFFGALLLTGFCSGLGTFARWRWSWIMVLSKSALIISMSLFLLNYVWQPEAVVQSSYETFWYLAFIATEVVAVVIALRHPLKDFLGVSKIKMSHLGAFGSLLCISSGLLLILLEGAFRFPLDSEAQVQVSTVFTSISDTSILCGLLITVGGVLILAGSNTLGGVISIIFGFFPPPLRPQDIPFPLPQQTTYHVYDLIFNRYPSGYGFLLAVAVGSLPIVGGLLALAGSRRLAR